MNQKKKAASGSLYIIFNQQQGNDWEKSYCKWEN